MSRNSESANVNMERDHHRSKEKDRKRSRHSRSRSGHRCSRQIKHHAPHCRKSSLSSSSAIANSDNSEVTHNQLSSSVNQSNWEQKRQQQQQQHQQKQIGTREKDTSLVKDNSHQLKREISSKVEIEKDNPRAKEEPMYKHEERLPESSEVVIDPPTELKPKLKKYSEVYKEPKYPVARGLKPSYAASARKVLMSSTRGLMRLQGTLSSNLSSLYVNEMFEDGSPCRVRGCPLNPSTRYISHKADEPLFSRSSSCTDSSLQVSKSNSFVDKRWCVCVGIAILFVGTFAAAGIYFGYEYLKTNQPIKERVYGGQFRVKNGEQVNDPGSIFHMQQTEKFRKKLHYLLNASPISKTYKGTEVFLLESDPDGILSTVHFNLHFDSDLKTRLFAKEIQSILEESLAVSNAIPQVEISSLEIHERRQQLYPSRKKLYPGQEEQPSYNLQDTREFSIDRNIPRQCSPVHSGYCSNLPYNLTTYPNMLHHTSIDQVDAVIDQIKEVVDSGCYPLAYELLCQVVQPVCYNDRIVKPCVMFCQEFMNACEGYIPKGLLDNLKCKTLPTEADGPGACISKPGCVGEMRENGLGSRVCDGVVDCPDFSDELYCDYCPEKHFHCGVGKRCIDKEKMCDSVEDCENGADEKGCLSLAPKLSVGSYIHQYHNEGYLLYQHNGRAGKVCIEGLNKTVPEDQIEIVIERLANSTCRALEYRKMSWAAVGRDEELEEIQYVGITALQDSDNFQSMECPSKMVVRMECDDLECGRRPANVHGKIGDSNEINTNENDITAKHGDWPWHVALFKEGTHVCDGTLIDKRWVMSTKSCFQGQQRAKWTAKLASVRLSNRAPWEQERRIIGMVASPVESHSIVILKLDKEVVFSDFARPVCLPAADNWVTRNDSNCVSLGWDTDAGQLQVLALNQVDKAQCEDKTEVNVNTICMEETESEKCIGEVVAGSGLMCQAAGEWHLVGVSAWRKGCGKVGERPRLYEKVSLTSEWAHTVINQDREKASPKVPRRRLGR